jgi:hypothetical protein
MNNKNLSRETLMIIIESVLWIFASLFARHQVDLAAGWWKIHEPWILVIKTTTVLILIMIAILLHNLLLRLFVHFGIIPPAKEE